MPNADAVSPVAATIAVVVEDGAVLLVRRRNPPDAGLWGFPGGKIEPGEPVRDAALRELQEETGLRATAERVFTALDVLERGADTTLRHHFVLVAVLCRDPVGALAPASDASEARWFRLDEIENAGLPTSFQVAEVARDALALASPPV